MNSDTLTAILFVAVVLVTVGITFWASRQNKGTADFYAGGRSFTGEQVDWMTYESTPRTFSRISQKVSPSLNRETRTWPSGISRTWAIS